MTGPGFPIPVTILTGFLGAGKTSLLNRLLKAPGFSNTAVIVNEFGEVGLDHLLVEQSGDGIIELSDGCLCCTVRGQLSDTLAELIERMQTGRTPPVDRIIIETTGLADPVPVMQAVSGHPVLGSMLRLASIVTAVDAVNGAATLAAHREARAQVAVADRLVLTKTDLADDATVADTLASVAALNGNAVPVTAPDDAGLPDLFRSDGWSASASREDLHHGEGHAHHHHHHHHHHDVSRHDERISSLSLVYPGAMSAGTVSDFLELLRSTHGGAILRLKGIIEIEGRPDTPLTVHLVQRLVHPPQYLDAWPDGTRGARIVVIGTDLDREKITRLFDAFVNRPRVDTPDRAALTDNPLAIRGTGGGW